MTLKYQKMNEFINFKNLYLFEINENFLGNIMSTECSDLMEFFYYISY